jgi:hypothetical protein
MKSNISPLKKVVVNKIWSSCTANLVIIKPGIFERFPIRIAVFFFITFLKVNAFSQKTVLVTKDNFSAMGWDIGQINKDASGAMIRKNSSDFVYITCTPPMIPGLQMGSVYLTLPVTETDLNLPNPTKDPTLIRVLLRNSSYSQVYLRDITKLMYSTYTVKQPVAPFLLLSLDIDGDDKFDNNIIFEPKKQSQAVQLDKWQEWDALNIGLWRLFKHEDTDPPEVAGDFTLKTFVGTGKFKNARIINSDPNLPMGGPGIRFTVFTDAPDHTDFRGYIDAFRIETPAMVVWTPSDPARGGGDLLYDFDGECLSENWWIHFLKKYGIAIIAAIVVILGCFRLFRNMRNKRTGNIKQ